MSGERFSSARWIEADGPLDALPVFERTFALERIGQAVVRICGLGKFELIVNGEKAGEDVLEPAWTAYEKRCLYVTHELRFGRDTFSRKSVQV